MIHFTVPAVPNGQPRQRHRVIRANGKTFAANYTPRDAPVQAYKATVRLAAQAAYDGQPLTGPVRLDAVFVFPRKSKPSWITKANELYWWNEWKAGRRVPHITKPDRDNLDKASLDALKGTLLRDDCIVCDGRLTKWIAAGDEQPHVEVTIAEAPA